VTARERAASRHRFIDNLEESAVSNDTSFATVLRAQKSSRLTGTVAVQPLTRRPHLRAGQAAAFLGLLAFTACATAEGPPGKSQVQLNFENNLCSMRAARGYRFMATEAVYAQCMLGFGNTVHLPDGRTFEPRYAYAPPLPQQPYVPPPSPQIASPETPEAAQEPAAPSVAPYTSSPDVPTRSGSLTSEQTYVLHILEEEAAKAAISCAFHSAVLRYVGEKGHGFRCFTIHTVEGAYNRISRDDVKTAVCSNPDALQHIPLVTPGVENEITNFVGCEQSS
jgi:hypothetical protein